MSACWEFFTLESPSSTTAKCKICSKDVPRGGSKVGKFNTSNLIKHLQNNHKTEHAVYLENSKKKKEPPPPELLQQNVDELFKRREKYDKDHPKAKAVTETITEMVVLDDQPFQVVENIGFRRVCKALDPRYSLPTRQSIADTGLPELHTKVSQYVTDQLSSVPAISFTTDIWSSSVNQLSMISLTAHWVDASESTFALKSVVLHSSEFPGKHSGETIARKMEDMLETWNIDKAKVHVVLRDNASNMKKAMEVMEVASLGCFAHSLNLVVNEGLLSQRSVKDALAIARDIIRHFKKSPAATSRLAAIQTDLNMPHKRLQQDVKTRWNSTFYMIESILEQKRAISAYVADHDDLPGTLTFYQWTLLEKTKLVLGPFEEMTKKISRSTSSASEVQYTFFIFIFFSTTDSSLYCYFVIIYFL